ncbi:FMN-dependent dehydrogenase-domain-containing protein [Hypoxylon sp. FL1284]|nr:FMN-dependent dehydrogenase-domain-containing protein [Hypoxylon sp. FL1284]
MVQTLKFSEVSKHTTTDSCWMILYGKVYDLTTYLKEHPGGRSIILENAGKDASVDYGLVHPVDFLDVLLTPEQMIGHVTMDDDADETVAEKPENQQQTGSEVSSAAAVPPLKSILSLAEIESHAMKQMSPKAISYYVSATDDELTKAMNSQIYRSILLRPRVFVDCTECSLATTILGNKVGLPIFVSPAAAARLAHPVGEAGIAGACSRFEALQIVSQNASLAPEAIVSAGPDAVYGWQLYVLKDRAATERTLAQVRRIPAIRFLVLTLDAPFPGKREADERFKAAEVAAGGPPQAWGTESALTWKKTLDWLSRHTDVPIVLKGILTHEDAYAASLFPAVKGIILSNHGGRALDTAPTPIQVLLEIRKFCPQVLDTIDVLVDGGIKRGTDVVKALALGAKGVGIGRAPLYGLSIGGQEGVERVLEILADETTTAMRLLGVKNVSELNPRHVNTNALTSRLFDGPSGLDEVERELQLQLKL